jgi:hypothetical protein
VAWRIQLLIASLSLSLALPGCCVSVILSFFPFLEEDKRQTRKRNCYQHAFVHRSFRGGQCNTHTQQKPTKVRGPPCTFLSFCTDRRAIRRLTHTTTTHRKPQVLVPVSAAVDPLNRPPTQKRREGRKKVVVVVVVIVVGRAVRPARLSLSPVQSGINWSAKINSTHADKNHSSKKVKHKLNPGMGFLFFIFSLLFFRLCVTYNITTYLWSLRKNVVQCYKRPGAVCVCVVCRLFFSYRKMNCTQLCVGKSRGMNHPHLQEISLQTKRRRRRRRKK